MSDDPHILIIGNPIDGFHFVGPFPSRRAAETWDKSVGGWVAPLDQPDEPTDLAAPVIEQIKAGFAALTEALAPAIEQIKAGFAALTEALAPDRPVAEVSVTHLLHCAIKSEGFPRLYLTCEDPTFSTCATVDAEGTPTKACFLLEWFAEVSDEMVAGTWPSDPHFPLPVTWQGDPDAPEIIHDPQPKVVHWSTYHLHGDL